MKKRKDENCRSGRDSRRHGFLMVIAAVCLLLSAVCRFVLPGVRFSSLLFLCGAGVCVGFALLNVWAAHTRAGRYCRFVSVCLLAAGFVVFLVVEGMILWAGERPMSNEEPEAVIVLGAGVNGTTPSLTLRTRLDAAAEYLQMHPDVPVVLSGGQGPGEEITEEQDMYTALVSCGISPDRLFLEERSASTAENLDFSREILAQMPNDPSAVVAVVTNDFHQFRAQLIACESGMTVIGVPAELPWWWLNANYYVREFFALGKLWLFG